MISASTWHLTKGISWSPSKGAIINSERESWRLEYLSQLEVLITPFVPVQVWWQIFFRWRVSTMASTRQTREKDEAVSRAGTRERNILLTEYLVYQICKCRVLEYFVCAHLKFENKSNFATVFIPNRMGWKVWCENRNKENCNMRVEKYLVWKTKTLKFIEFLIKVFASKIGFTLILKFSIYVKI